MNVSARRKDTGVHVTDILLMSGAATQIGSRKSPEELSISIGRLVKDTPDQVLAPDPVLSSHIRVQAQGN